MTRRNLLQLIMLSIAIALATSVLAWWTCLDRSQWSHNGAGRSGCRYV
jgi:NO-binding membrane sensor protein with MHYT domain